MDRPARDCRVHPAIPDPVPCSARVRIEAGRERIPSDRQGPVFDDALHDEGGAQSLYSGEVGESLVVELLERGKVTADDPEQIIGIAEESLGLDDVRHRSDRILEGREGGIVRSAHGDEDERLEREAERVRVEVRVIAGDGPGALESA